MTGGHHLTWDSRVAGPRVCNVSMPKVLPILLQVASAGMCSHLMGCCTQFQWKAIWSYGILEFDASPLQYLCGLMTAFKIGSQS